MSDTGGASPARHPFGDRLAAAVAARESQVVLGIDPDTTKLWPDAVEAMAESRERLVHALDDAERSTGLGRRRPARDIRLQAAAAVLAHCLALVDAAGPACVAVKPQLAHFERLGFAGLLALEATVAHARAQDLLVIADAKRGDIASTATAYAQAWLGDVPTPFGRSAGLHADAMTLNPLLGADALEPFAAMAARARAPGLFVLVRTSNPGAADFFDLELADGGPLWERLARLVAEAGTPGPESGLAEICAVTGATRAGAPRAHARADAAHGLPPARASAPRAGASRRSRPPSRPAAPAAS